MADCVLFRPSSLPLSALVSLTVSAVTLKLIIALLTPVSLTVSGLALSRDRAPFLPSSSLAADAAGPRICLRHSLSSHRLPVSPTPSFRSQLSRPPFTTIPLGDRANFLSPIASRLSLSRRYISNELEMSHEILSIECTSSPELSKTTDSRSPQQPQVSERFDIATYKAQ
ncbi:hypothetical protein HN873_004841 [Arachis hypogaea]